MAARMSAEGVVRRGMRTPSSEGATHPSPGGPPPRRMRVTPTHRMRRTMAARV